MLVHGTSKLSAGPLGRNVQGVSRHFPADVGIGIFTGLPLLLSKLVLMLLCNLLCRLPRCETSTSSGVCLFLCVFVCPCVCGMRPACCSLYPFTFESYTQILPYDMLLSIVRMRCVCCASRLCILPSHRSFLVCPWPKEPSRLRSDHVCKHTSVARLLTLSRL